MIQRERERIAAVRVTLDKSAREGLLSVALILAIHGIGHSQNAAHVLGMVPADDGVHAPHDGLDFFRLGGERNLFLVFGDYGLAGIVNDEGFHQDPVKMNSMRTVDDDGRLWQAGLVDAVESFGDGDAIKVGPQDANGADMVGLVRPLPRPWAHAEKDISPSALRNFKELGPRLHDCIRSPMLGPNT